jgi:hypothetical protein
MNKRNIFHSKNRKMQEKKKRKKKAKIKMSKQNYEEA